MESAVGASVGGLSVELPVGAGCMLGRQCNCALRRLRRHFKNSLKMFVYIRNRACDYVRK